MLQGHVPHLWRKDVPISRSAVMTWWKVLCSRRIFFFICQVLEMKLSFRVRESFVWSESKNTVGRIKGQVKFRFLHLKVQSTMKKNAVKCLVTSGRRRRPLICFTARLKGFCFLFGRFVMNLELQANQTDSNMYCSVTIGETVCSWHTFYGVLMV